MKPESLDQEGPTPRERFEASLGVIEQALIDPVADARSRTFVMPYVQYLSEGILPLFTSRTLAQIQARLDRGVSEVRERLTDMMQLEKMKGVA